MGTFWAGVGILTIAIGLYIMVGCFVWMVAEEEGPSPERMYREIHKPGGTFWTIVLWPIVLIIMLGYGVVCLWNIAFSYKRNASATNGWKLVTSAFRRDS